jgi:hypothetical protein
MDVFKFKIIPSKTLLDDEIILYNLIETDRIKDARYIMSAGVAWLRRYPGKTLFDLQKKIIQLKLKTRIFTEEFDPEEQDVCVPGNPAARVKYAATFISNPQILYRQKHGKADMEKLCNAGYGCAKGYASYISNVIKPDIKYFDTCDVLEIMQWAAARIRVEHDVVNPDDELTRDLREYQGKYSRSLILSRPNKRERLYGFMGETDYVSEYGILETTNIDGRATAKLVVHLPSYLQDT